MNDISRQADIKVKVAQILKNVDKLVKSGELHSALQEVLHAKELEPRNPYVHAYEERIRLLQEEEKRNRLQKEARKLAEDAAEQKRKAEQARLADEAKKSFKEEHERRLQREMNNAQAQQARQYAEALAAYNKVLYEAWEDGAVTPEEDRRLKEFRSSFGISAEEHCTLQAGAKRECYVAAFKKLWSSGSLTPGRASTLAELRRRFNITAEEYEVIENELLQELRSPNTATARIAVIEDDTQFLGSLKMALQSEGFQVEAFETSDEAFSFLRDQMVDIILSDINLETSTMGGLAFYQKVRDLEHLVRVPFLFLSGLTDEAIICAGKELGVDDYITKPFDFDALVAIIKGKLKRYRTLNLIHHH